MSKKKHIKISNKPSNEIQAIPSTINKKIIFSFEYLDTKNSKYSMSQISDNRISLQFHNEFFKVLKDYSQEENFRKKIREDGRYRDRHHIHEIDWNDKQIKESNFTCLNSKLMEQVKDDCWQLGINATTFRIHGFFIENVFYIVWLDPFHQLYHMKKYN